MHPSKAHRAILQDIARRAMVARNLLPGFPPEAEAELEGMKALDDGGPGTRDLRHLPWCSIDNARSRGLDQLTAAEALAGGRTRILVAVADVAGRVGRGSAIDLRARHNTISVYTAAQVFPMLPDRLSTDFTSLNPEEDRLATIADMVAGPDGSLEDFDMYVARVRSRARLSYGEVAAWLEDPADLPLALSAVPGLADNLGLQDAAAQRMKAFRHAHGALSLETRATAPVFRDGELLDLAVEGHDRAKDLVETFMVTANGVAARFLASRSFPSLRRVVRTPKRWERIVQLAKDRGFPLPERPDSTSLEAFLVQEKAADPRRFPDLCLSVIKLLGAGEYVSGPDPEGPAGHFGLAARDDAHATAPNRRYPDLVTQRLLKAAMGAGPCPYTAEELADLARHCTEAEDAARKVERQVGKSAASLLLVSRIGETFDGVVTGAAPKGTWVRLLHPPVEGRLVEGGLGLDVGDPVRAKLIAVDVERGFIDLEGEAPRAS